MKRLLFVLALAVAVGAASYVTCYRHVMATAVLTPDGTDADLAWLKREFALTPAQFEKVLALHHAYCPVCADHCARYAAERTRLESLLKEKDAWSPEIGQTVAAIAAIRSECRQSMLHHAYEVAACMSPEEGRRYLDMIREQVLAEEPAGMMAHSH